MSTWKDETGYSQSEPLNERVARSWHYKLPCFTVIIHRLHGLNPNDWYLSCHRFNIKNASMRNTDVDLAKEEALDRIELFLTTSLETLQKSRGTHDGPGDKK